ncbi:MAG: hypothetical protein K5784_08930 [Clostridiales bacterium]|nr:hypothetical protein [Clostridiales bacterium]
MKKLLLTVLALLIALTVLAEGDIVPEGAEKFIGDWQDGETFILMDWDDECFRVLIIQGRDDGQTEWEYSCLYDSETGALASLPYGVRREVVFDDNGEFVSSDEVYGDGEAAFAIDENDRLTWQDEKDGAGDGLVFERLPGFEPLFSDMREALADEGYTGFEGTSCGYYVAVVEVDGALNRVAAELDETALKLEDAIYESDDLSAAVEAYEDYVRTLPVSYLEEIVQQSMTEEETAQIIGKTIGELEEQGFEALSFDDGSEAFVVTMAFGMYDYDLTVNESVDIQALWDGKADYETLTVKSAVYAGLSPNVTDLNYLPDGTWYDTEFGFEGEDDGFDLMEALFEAVQSGELDLETLESTLREAVPDQADEIMGYLKSMIKTFGASEDEDAGD